MWSELGHRGEHNLVTHASLLPFHLAMTTRDRGCMLCASPASEHLQAAQHQGFFWQENDKEQSLQIQGRGLKAGQRGQEN